MNIFYIDECPSKGGMYAMQRQLKGKKMRNESDKIDKYGYRRLRQISFLENEAKILGWVE